MLANRFESKVVGVTFVEGYPENLQRLALINPAARVAFAAQPEFKEILGEYGPEYLPAVLIRNPDNKFDANAIEVHVPSVGMVGHLPKRLAALLAPEIDDDIKWRSGVVGVYTHPKHPDQPGMSVRLERVEE